MLRFSEDLYWEVILDSLFMDGLEHRDSGELLSYWPLVFLLLSVCRIRMYFTRHDSVRHCLQHFMQSVEL